MQTVEDTWTPLRGSWRQKDQLTQESELTFCQQIQLTDILLHIHPQTFSLDADEDMQHLTLLPRILVCTIPPGNAHLVGRRQLYTPLLFHASKSLVGRSSSQLIPLHHISWKRHFTLVLNGLKSPMGSNILAEDLKILVFDFPFSFRMTTRF